MDTPPRNRVVVGVGESHSGTRALAWALDLGRRTRSVVEVVTVWPDLGQLLVHDVPGHYCEPRGRAVAALTSALAECGVRPGAADVRVHVVNDDPVRALVARSEGADLLVVGAGGRGRSRRAGLEAVGASCRRQASCPVVVVDGEAEATGPVADAGRTVHLAGR